jgi:formate-dependent nitrite reductase membrane component NrfD
VTRDLGPQNVFMDRFTLEPKTQRVWGVRHATWFTLMGVGGGIFIVAHLANLQTELGAFLGMPAVDLLSFLAIAVGGVILIADLGRPMRFWRAVLSPRASWISRGAIADFVFLGAGGLLIVADLKLGNTRPLDWLPWDSRAKSGAGLALEVVALLSAAVVTFYAGQVLAAPKAIPYWHSPAVPTQFVLSSVATSASIILLLEVLNDRTVSAGQLWVMVVSLALLLAVTGWHLTTRAEAPGKNVSLDKLLRGEYRVPFLAGVLGVGTVLPLGLGLIGLAAEGARDVVAVASVPLTVPAGFALRLVTLRVGIFPPVRSILPAAP